MSTLVCTEENIEKVLDMYNDGHYPYTSIAGTLGISLNSVKKIIGILKAEGKLKDRKFIIGPRVNLETPANIEFMRKCEREGKTQLEVACEFGVSPTTISRIAKKYGICINTRKKEESLEEAMERTEKAQLGYEYLKKIDESESEIVSMYKDGVAIADIAGRLGISVAGVCAVLNNMGEFEDDVAEKVRDIPEKEEEKVEEEEEEKVDEEVEEELEDIEEIDSVDELQDALNKILTAHGKILMDMGYSGYVNGKVMGVMSRLNNVEHEVMDILNQLAWVYDGINGEGSEYE